jgi:hypothetical protein
MAKMFIETRFYDSGEVMARLYEHSPCLSPEGSTDEYDYRVDEVGDAGDWLGRHLKAENGLSLTQLVRFGSGKWVDLTQHV